MVQRKLKFWKEYFELKNGRVKVFKRKGVSDKFYARFTFRGEKGYVQESLKTSNKDEATETALEKYLQFEFKLRQGLSLKRKTFKEITTEYLQATKLKVERNEIHYRKYHLQELYINRYFDDFFGEFAITDIQKKEVDQYREWRKNYWITGKGSKERHITYVRAGKTIKRKIHASQRSKIAASTTVNSEETALRAIFKFAIMCGYVSANEVVQIKTERVKFNQRATFTPKEYWNLLKVARKRIIQAEKANRDREAHLRVLVYNFILIASNCGTRTTELMHLRWKEIEWKAKDGAGNESVILSVSGKAKSRDLVANDVCREYLNRILERHKKSAAKYNWKFTGTDEFVFSDHLGRRIKSMKGNFEALLKDSGLAKDKSGKKRSLSSFRIYYCTMRLMKGQNIDIYDLALQMGTSVELLQKTYSRLTPRLKAQKIKSVGQRASATSTAATTET